MHNKLPNHEVEEDPDQSMLPMFDVRDPKQNKARCSHYYLNKTKKVR